MDIKLIGLIIPGINEENSFWCSVFAGKDYSAI